MLSKNLILLSLMLGLIFGHPILAKDKLDPQPSFDDGYEFIDWYQFHNLLVGNFMNEDGEYWDANSQQAVTVIAKTSRAWEKNVATLLDLAAIGFRDWNCTKTHTATQDYPPANLLDHADNVTDRRRDVEIVTDFSCTETNNPTPDYQAVDYSLKLVTDSHKKDSKGNPFEQYTDFAMSCAIVLPKPFLLGNTWPNTDYGQSPSPQAQEELDDINKQFSWLYDNMDLSLALRNHLVPDGRGYTVSHFPLNATPTTILTYFRLDAPNHLYEDGEQESVQLVDNAGLPIAYYHCGLIAKGKAEDDKQHQSLLHGLIDVRQKQQTWKQFRKEKKWKNSYLAPTDQGLLAAGDRVYITPLNYQRTTTRTVQQDFREGIWDQLEAVSSPTYHWNFQCQLEDLLSSATKKSFMCGPRSEEEGISFLPYARVSIACVPQEPCYLREQRPGGKFSLKCQYFDEEQLGPQASLKDLIDWWQTLGKNEPARFQLEWAKDDVPIGPYRKNPFHDRPDRDNHFICRIARESQHLLQSLWIFPATNWPSYLMLSTNFEELSQWDDAYISTGDQ